MNDKAKHLIAAMREDAEWAHVNEWETPITLGDNLEEAADIIEHLFEDRDAWKKRCKAAEMDIRRMLPPGNESCRYCDKFAKIECTWESCPEIAAWRGPCGENGGVE